MNAMKIILLFFFIICCSSVEQNESSPYLVDDTYYLGADLSYVNEMEDCGAIYRNSSGTAQDPYTIFGEANANLVRLRLWHTPKWTNYSTLEDVKKSIKRAKEAGMQVLLAFHYSDDWADPSSQDVPIEWMGIVDDTTELGNALYTYTAAVLDELNNLSLMPDFVQVGNEINAMILQRPNELEPIDWERNQFLINMGIKAVRDVSSKTGQDIHVMLHIAQPENALIWFKDATQNGISNFDYIGISYYPKWSSQNLTELSQSIRQLIDNYGKEVMIVETAYPYDFVNQDSANNILGVDSLHEGFPASQDGQLSYLTELHSVVKSAGGSGVLYWEPAWVSTSCSTRWGAGSHWENAAMFDAVSKPTKAMTWFDKPKR